MYFRGPAVGLTYCCFYLASYFTNKYVLSVLKFTYPTLFQGWQTFVGGLLLHVCWKLGWVEINTSSSVILLTFASRPTGDLLSALEFPFLYFYRFHSGCCASGILGFLLALTSVKLKGSLSSAHHASWSFFAKVITACLSLAFFDITMNVPLTLCFLIGVLGEALLVYTERAGA
ncbi:hypothetical protein FKM82_006217 [Ascaphus truei]